jgi:hypothetical protein
MRIEDTLICQRIFCFLIYSESITNLSLVCRSWKKILSDEEFWKQFLLSNFYSLRWMITKPYYFTFDILCYKAYDFMEIQYFTFFEKKNIWLGKVSKMLKETGYVPDEEIMNGNFLPQYFSEKLDDLSELIKISETFRFDVFNTRKFQKPKNFKVNTTNKIQWNDFVPEILTQIFLFCQVEDFNSLSLVNENWYQILGKDSDFWDSYLLQIYSDYKRAALKKLNYGIIVKTKSCPEFYVKHSIERSFMNSINKLDEILTERIEEIKDFSGNEDAESKGIRKILKVMPKNKNENIHIRAYISPILGAPGIKNYGHIKLKSLNQEYFSEIDESFPTPLSHDIFLGILGSIQMNQQPILSISCFRNPNFKDKDIIAIFDALISKEISLRLFSIHIKDCPRVNGEFIKKIIKILNDPNCVCTSFILKGCNLDPKYVKIFENFHKQNVSYYSFE